MPVLHHIEDFLRLRDAGLPLLDVRSPAEFQKAHMAGAHNLPLFSDEERARVGTAYARQGQEAATLLALRLVGGRLADMVETARQICPSRPLTPEAAAELASCATRSSTASPASPVAAVPPLPGTPSAPARHVLLHCWRGGLRSRSVGWLLESCGFTVHLLRGGYRAFRTHVRKELARPRPVLVLGGMTGCGKTDILHALADRGEQIIDLESLANHRGSAFGAVALNGGQPGNEAFENSLFEQWRALDPRRPVWLEDESRRIGHVTLCEEFSTISRPRRCLWWTCRCPCASAALSPSTATPLRAPRPIRLLPSPCARPWRSCAAVWAARPVRAAANWCGRDSLTKPSDACSTITTSVMVTSRRSAAAVCWDV